MSTFAEAGLVFAGGSNPVPERNYIVRAGSSIPENRDYIVVRKRNFFHAGGVVTVSSGLLGIGNFYSIQPKSSAVTVSSGIATLAIYSSLLLSGETGVVTVASGGARILRVVQHLSSSLQIASGVAGLSYNRLLTLSTLPLGVGSTNASLAPFTASVMATETGALEVRSGLLTIFTVKQLQVLRLGVSSGLLRTQYSRVFETAPLTLGVASSQASLTTFTPITLEAESSVVQITSSDLSTDIRRYVSFQTCNLAVGSGATAFLYDRILHLATHDLGVSSGVGTLIFNTLTGGSVAVSSSQTILGYQYRLELVSGSIEVRSSNARFFNPYLVGLTRSIGVSSPAAELRFLPTGFLPSTAPSSRSFQPPSYRIEKTTVFNHGTVRQVMCSKPSDATLTLEYLNVSDAFAEEVLTAYDQSYGTRYGFKLPPEVVSGAGSDLLGYINLNNSTLKWFYADTPSVEAVGKGICNLNVQLRARVEAR